MHITPSRHVSCSLFSPESACPLYRNELYHIRQQDTVLISVHIDVACTSHGTFHIHELLLPFSYSPEAFPLHQSGEPDSLLIFHEISLESDMRPEADQTYFLRTIQVATR